jgi:sortase B
MMPQKDSKHTSGSSDDPSRQRHAPRHSSQDGAAQAKERKKRTVIFLSIALVILVAGAGAGAGYLVWQHYQLDRMTQEAKEAPVPVVQATTPEAEKAPEAEPLAEAPVDFAALRQENPDIYAWLYIPNTEVNHPVLQHPNDDFYYLAHNRDAQQSVEGALYTQKANSTDFSDPVTLIYGHNMINGGMFATLHYFEDADFFAGNDTFYIYAPGHILTYQVVSAYMYDDRHILNSFDFSDPQVLQGYFAFVQDPDALIANTRGGTGLSAADRVVQLSTCMSEPAYSTSRYIVSGVLVDDEPTS